MKLWAKARKRTHDEVINHFGSQACLWAVKFTPKAALGKFPLNATADPEKGGKTHKQRFYYALAAKTGARRGEGIKDKARNRYKKRRSGSGFLRAGFLRPASELGAKVRSMPRPGGEADRSKGTKSRGGRQRAKSFNNAEGSGDIAYKPMQKAMGTVAKLEGNFAIRRLQKANNRFSAKQFH